jgi:hypothetical protein
MVYYRNPYPNKPISFLIVDLYGRAVNAQYEEISENLFEIPIANLNSGFYVLIIIESGGLEHKYKLNKY